MTTTPAGAPSPTVSGTRTPALLLPADPAEVTRLARRLEAPFAAAGYDGRPRAAEFRWLPGPGRVLISAPHTVNHLRDGRPKIADRYSGAIARLVQRLTGNPAILRTRGPAGDPNWDRESAYKDEIAIRAARGEIIAVIDIHGAAREHPFALALGTAGRGGVWSRSLAELARERIGGRVWLDGDYFTASHPGTVTWLVARRLGIPAIQIEVNGFYRSPVRRPAAFAQAVSTIAALAEQLGTIPR